MASFTTRLLYPGERGLSYTRWIKAWCIPQPACMWWGREILPLPYIKPRNIILPLFSKCVLAPFVDLHIQACINALRGTARHRRKPFHYTPYLKIFTMKLSEINDLFY
jgi:hypothetical protein